MSSELKVILLKGIEEGFRKECGEMEKRLEHITSILIKIADNGGWKLPITVRGMETHFPECEKDLNLLEKSGLIEGEMRYTEHNSYRMYVVSEEGKLLVTKLRACAHAPFATYV